ncbi:phosphatase PAP2 family protein [Virgibacillus soli]
MIKRKIPSLLLLLVFPILGIVYNYINDLPSKATNIAIPIDDYIPFVPIFVIPYILWYAFVFCYLIYFWYKNTRVYIHSIVTIVIAEIICFLCYIFFQTTVTRPELVGNGFFFDLVRNIYANDAPLNCFPSIHVLTTFMIMIGSIHIKKKHILNTIFIQTMGLSIILSTVLIKQHVILDVIASILIVSVIYSTLVFISMKRKTAKSSNKTVVIQLPTKQHQSIRSKVRRHNKVR